MSRERYGLHFCLPSHPAVKAVQIYNLRQTRLSLSVSFCLVPTKNADYETLHQLSLDSTRALRHPGKASGQSAKSGTFVTYII